MECSMFLMGEIYNIFAFIVSGEEKKYKKRTFENTS
jgi:hypothetical protein